MNATVKAYMHVKHAKLQQNYISVLFVIVVDIFIIEFYAKGHVLFMQVATNKEQTPNSAILALDKAGGIRINC